MADTLSNEIVERICHRIPLKLNGRSLAKQPQILLSNKKKKKNGTDLLLESQQVTTGYNK